jgi:hypothetical protein
MWRVLIILLVPLDADGVTKRRAQLNEVTRGMPSGRCWTSPGSVLPERPSI